MKKRYELQYANDSGRWARSYYDVELPLLKEKRAHVDEFIGPYHYRVVQKLGRKVIKVIYPKGK